MSLKIAKRYAQSIFELLDDSKSVESSIKSLQCFMDELAVSDKAKKFVFNNYINTKLKVVLIDAIIKKCKIKGLSANFLHVLVQNNRLEHLPLIINQLNKMHDEQNNVLQVEVVLAKQVKPAGIRQMQKVLEEQFDKAININVKIDENIIGGLKFKTDGLLYDASVGNMLKKLRQCV